METAERLNATLAMPCKNCGAQMLYDAKRQLMHCHSCGSEAPVPADNHLIEELDFSDALALASSGGTGFGLSQKMFACKNCGAHTAVDAATVSIVCPFCASSNVNEEAYDQLPIRPAGVIPFKIEKRLATDKFKEWIGKGFFSPGNLKKLAELNKLDGVYVPFWTYDADTSSSWTAEAGYYYYTTETYTDAQGKTQTRQKQHVRWEYVSGHYDHFFDDVLVVASGGVTQNLAERVYPYTLAEAINYDSKFLLGWKAEVYAKNVQQGYEVAEGIMDGYIRSEITRQIPGDTHRNLSINTHKSGVTFKHLLLPLWVAAYQYRSKTYQVLVNGQTGKVGGQKPISWIKVALVVVLVLIVAATLYYLFGRQETQ